LVASYARPGGNATGTSNFGAEIAAKNLRLFAEVVPRLARVGVLYGRDALPYRYSQPSRAAAAKEPGMTLRPRPLAKPEDIEAAFDAARAEGDQAVIVQWDAFTTKYEDRIARNAVRVRMPCLLQSTRLRRRRRPDLLRSSGVRNRPTCRSSRREASSSWRT